MAYRTRGITPTGKTHTADGTPIESTGWVKGTSCPNGQVAINSRTDKVHAMSIGGGYTEEWVECGLIPRKPDVNIDNRQTNFEVSPAIQTSVVPTVSPVFSQMQDSPYANQSGQTTATPTTSASADKSTNDAITELLRMMELENREKAETERKERERYEQQQQQLYAERQALLDRQTQARENQLAQQQAQIEAQLQRAMQYTQPQPQPQPVINTANPATVETVEETEEKRNYTPLLVLLALGVGVGLYSQQNKPKRRKK